jgi:hypothetical protein
MADNDFHIERFDTYLTKLFDRLADDYAKIDLKEYATILATAGQAVLRLIAMRKGTDDADTGSAVREFSTAFTKNAANRGKPDPGAAADLAAVKRQIHGNHPDAQRADASDAN